jgi:formylglycine-generating enzyme required for sulfatase activity
MGSNTSAASTCREDNCPVDNVSWNEVQDFVSRLNSRSSGSKYRLPTEAEWEYAARSGGKRELYSGGNDVDRVAWYDGNSDYRLHPVGAKAPNRLGLHDMSGNIWEMTNDWYGSDYYSKSPRNNPTGPDKPEGPEIDRVVRGGCATGGPPNHRTTKRSYAYEHTTPTDRSMSLGFRLLRTP